MKDILVNITFPVLNEERILKEDVMKFYNFLKKSKFPYRFEITICDNGSIDDTKKVGEKLEKKVKEINYLRLSRKGRNFALKSSWTKSKASVVSYMDIDLATDLRFFLPMINMIIKDNCDLVVGNRLGLKSKVIDRNFKREFLSRNYNLLLRMFFFHKIRDHQCGFKAIKRNSFLKLNKEIPDIKEEIWFLDTELIIRAIKNKMKVEEIDVIWKDDPDSKVKVVKAVLEDLKGIVRLRKEFLFK